MEIRKAETEKRRLNTPVAESNEGQFKAIRMKRK